jgi:hypothetical protein
MIQQSGPETIALGEVAADSQTVRTYAGRMDGALDFGIFLVCVLLVWTRES